MMKSHFLKRSCKLLTKSLFTILMASMYVDGYSQNQFYYTLNQEKLHLTPISGKYIVNFTSNLNEEEQAILLEQGERLTPKSFVIYDPSILSNFQKEHYVQPCYLTQVDGAELKPTNHIVCKFKPTTTQEEKNALLTSLGISKVSSNTIQEIYFSTNVFADSKTIYESNLVDFAHPDFYADVTTNSIPNDHYFNKQYYLHNTGQVVYDPVGYGPGLPDADIDAPEAWDITTGNSDIVVAVIDAGVIGNHIDLPNSRQIRLPGSDFTNYGNGSAANDPSPHTENTIVGGGNNHGNSCAGIIAATQNNGIGITGIAPNSKIMPIQIFGEYAVTTSNIANSYLFAVQNNSNIISNSWSFNDTENSPNIFPAILNAINHSIENNITVIHSAGNTADGTASDGAVLFPGNNDIDGLIVVGSSTDRNQKSQYSPKDTEIEVVAPSSLQDIGWALNVYTLDLEQSYGTNGGDNPSHGGFPFNHAHLPQTTEPNWDHFSGRFGGTSASCPQVSGTIALMLSVNPCLGPKQIEDIIKHTADKVNPTTETYNYNWNALKPGHSKELGYGKLNAHQAVYQAQRVNSSALDLFIKDRPEDFGGDDNHTDGDGEYHWQAPRDNSPDIWVRNQPDGLVNREHQQPDYSLSPVYVYVKVRNKSCIDADDIGDLKLYWSQAATSSSWSDDWDGTNVNQGGLIGTTSVTVEAGGYDIYQFQWNIIDPNIYDNWSTCLMARMDNVPGDDITEYLQPNFDGTTSSRLFEDVFQNNNIAMKNLTIVESQLINYLDWNDRIHPIRGNYFNIGNPFDIEVDYNLHFSVPEEEYNSPITKEAEVSFALSQNDWGILESHLISHPDIEVRGGGIFVLKDKDVILNQVTLPAGVKLQIMAGFNFLTKEVSQKNDYKFDVQQFLSSTGEPVGGEYFIIPKNDRHLFRANAGQDQTTLPNSTVNLSAQSPSESVLYNWYASSGELIATGKDISVNSEISNTYKLEIISDVDGFKDYDEVEVKVVNAFITNISPNPASEYIQVNYVTEEVQNAYISIVSSGDGLVNNNYLLTPNSSELTIDVSQYTPGPYTVTLIVNGEVTHAQTIIVN